MPLRRGGRGCWCPAFPPRPARARGRSLRGVPRRLPPPHAPRPPPARRRAAPAPGARQARRAGRAGAAGWGRRVTANRLVTLHSRVLALVGPLLLGAVLIADPRWTGQLPATLLMVVAAVLLRGAQVPLSKYSYLTQTGLVALGGSLLVGLPAAAAFAALGVLFKHTLEEAIAAEELNKIHAMEAVITSNISLQDSFVRIERLAHRLVDWGDFRIYRRQDGALQLAYRGFTGRPERGEPSSDIAELREQVARSGEAVVLDDVTRDPRGAAAAPSVPRRATVRVKVGRGGVRAEGDGGGSRRASGAGGGARDPPANPRRGAAARGAQGLRERSLDAGAATRPGEPAHHGLHRRDSGVGRHDEPAGFE